MSTSIVSTVMRSVLAAVAIVGLTVTTAAAQGRGGFGGFSGDESHYLRGAEHVCEPVPADAATSAAPDCDRADPDRVAELGFRKPGPEGGPRARVRARARGTTLELFRRGEDEPVVRWKAGSPIDEVGDVFVSESGTLVAVEIATRLGSRRVQSVVGFELGQGDSEAPAFEVPKPDADAKPDTDAAAASKPNNEKGYRRASKAGRRLAKRRRWKRAERAFRKALEYWPGSPGARYRLAVALARQGRTKAAVEQLERLAASEHPDAIVWQVEARFDDAFDGVRADDDFRRAALLEGGPSSPRAYERLVGLGGRWEQAGASCQEAEVDMHLERLSREFDLVLRSRCRGRTEVTRLGGSWKAIDPDRLELTFPNPDGEDEVLQCRISACDDRPGEDCIRCSIEDDLWFVLREVRR